MDFPSLPLSTSRDHVTRNAWIGPSFPLDLSDLVEKFEEIPVEYPSLSQS
jgi:DOPA 4,5-dioxygenase